ncbi:hypothetical protein J1G44_07345 [Cellulomonas sp. zg-ZUI199]|uniref:Uncharacterized protein n=1 Tax=Cellulomonas wangleii TaxID=2816956 RepID=A0ABX8D4C5_9CELL|nr:hypothetical protein [Cellulomonas wangleii]MBO0924298.1 hypothetical protein [Cellulomonas wangleii]QVI62308.1 hypothetical protein KG103_18190 [Cellulomonas wangleii]
MPLVIRRALASVLLLSAAAMFVAAAAQRWWPACGPGLFDSDTCLRLQDHVFDYLVAYEPWTPVGQAAQYAGVAFLLLAGAAAVLPFLLVRRPLWLQVPAAVLGAAVFAVIGAYAWTSGEAGRAQPGDAVNAATFVWALVLPGGLGVWSLIDLVDEPWPGERHTRWRGALTAALVASTPLPQLSLGPITVGYSSHDTSPWSDAALAVPLAVAAALVWKATPGGTTPPRRTDADLRVVPSPSRPAG